MIHLDNPKSKNSRPPNLPRVLRLLRQDPEINEPVESQMEIELLLRDLMCDFQTLLSCYNDQSNALASLFHLLEHYGRDYRMLAEWHRTEDHTGIPEFLGPDDLTGFPDFLIHLTGSLQDMKEGYTA
jgi:hypothetical protein